MTIDTIHTINAFTPLSGGTATCTYDLLCGLNKRDDVQARIIVTQPQQPLMGNGEEWIMSVANDERTQFGISSNLEEALRKSDAGIYHTNGLWRYCNHITAVIARQKRKPYVITSHGMLYPQALEQSKWQKRLLRLTMFDRDIREAACIHATSEEEMQHIRALGFTNPVAVIANPVPMPAIPPIVREKKVLFGYLGRLHPRKHVERIITAMAQLSEEEQKYCELVIMGSGDEAYEASLRAHASQSGARISFAGFVEGEEKYKRLAGLSALFVPSDFENFGMIIAEALACGTPVFANITTPWRILNDKGCGWWQEATPENMASVMRDIILSMSPKKIDEMGIIGREMVAEYFSAEGVARQMAELYQWILTKQHKPSFVYD